MLRRLLRDGHGVVVLDNLSSGHRAAVQGCELVVGDLLDAPLLERVFVRHRFDAVMHFGAKSLVAESVREPYVCHRNNVDGTRSLLAAMRAHALQRLLFSSTAAMCGMPLTNTIDEDHPRNPISPYGRSKMMVEDILRDAVRAHGLRSVSRRYFNAAGASADASIGDAHEPETHLTPNVLRAAAAGAAPLPVYGTDYPTRDGTCVRDYVHVEDLADEHLAAHDGAHAINSAGNHGTRRSNRSSIRHGVGIVVAATEALSLVQRGNWWREKTTILDAKNALAMICAASSTAASEAMNGFRNAS